MPLTPNFRGSWSSTSQYFAGDLVYYQGSSWIATVDNVNYIPGNSYPWTLFVLGGVPGPTGAAGPQGTTSGTFRWLGEWVEGTQYTYRDCVGFSYGSFVCISPTSNHPLTGDIHSSIDPSWSRMSAGVPLVFRGAWDEFTEYYVNDVVNYQDSIYVAGTTSLGVPPTAGYAWMLMVQFAGITGPTGSSVPTAEVGFTSSGGNFTVANNLGYSPSFAVIQMTSLGQVVFQPTRWDINFFYLNGASGGLTGYIEAWR